MKDIDGDPRRTSNVPLNATVDLRRATGEIFREGGMKGVGAAGGAGSSAVVVNVDVEKSPTPPPTVAS